MKAFLWMMALILVCNPTSAGESSESAFRRTAVSGRPTGTWWRTTLQLEIPEGRSTAVEDACVVLERRLKSYDALKGARIYSGAQDLIFVEVPGDDDGGDVIRAMTLDRGHVDFRMVHRDNDEKVRQLFDQKAAPPGYRIVSAERHGIPQFCYRWDSATQIRGLDLAELAAHRHRWQAGPGYDFMMKTEVLGDGSLGEGTLYTPVFVVQRGENIADHIAAVVSSTVESGGSTLTVTFNDTGARRLALLTSDYAPGGVKNPAKDITRQIALVVDGNLLSVHAIDAPITDGIITFPVTMLPGRAKDMANIMSAGPLPGRMRIQAVERINYGGHTSDR